MTREDLDKECLIGMYSKYSKSGIFDHLVYAIDYIEIIESRTCESCKYNYECDVVGLICDNKDSKLYPHEVDNTVCCNKWESK
jgi:hypothetical protein